MTKTLFHILRAALRAFGRFIDSIEFTDGDPVAFGPGLTDAAGLPTTSAADGVFIRPGF
jgi:hypothetical protein